MGATFLLWAALSHAQYFPRRVPGHARRSLQGNRPPPPDSGSDSSSGSGSTSSDACPGTDGETCDNAGSTGYADASGLTFDVATGKFSGEFVTNGCNDQPRTYDGELFPGTSTASCESQTIPAYESSSGLPTLGRAGMTLSGGVNIYSAFEAGFNECSDGMPYACCGASCEGGVDVLTCEAHLEYACTDDVNTLMFMDSCGGHAEPYHIHTDPVCNYEASESGHSTAVGVMLSVLHP